MQETVKFALGIWLLAVTVVPLAGGQQSAQPGVAQGTPSQGAQTGLPIGPAFLKKTVAFLTVGYKDGNEHGQVQGTAFFVFLEDNRIGEGGGFVYLVTNRHMAQPKIEEGRRTLVQRVSLRLNLKSTVAGAQSEEINLPLGNGLRWYFPEDNAVDLAVMPVAPNENRYDYEFFPVSLFATKELIESQRVEEGEAVFFSGFFYQFPGLKKIQPVVRQGTLAMMPDEQLPTTLRGPGRLYLADVHTFGGNSGAPMFVNLGGIRGGALIRSLFPYRLLGIVSGYFYETQDFRLEVATTLEGRANANSGISVVVPSDELKALLNSPQLRQQRDAQVPRGAK